MALTNVVEPVLSGAGVAQFVRLVREDYPRYLIGP